MAYDLVWGCARLPTRRLAAAGKGLAHRVIGPEYSHCKQILQLRVYRRKHRYIHGIDDVLTHCGTVARVRAVLPNSPQTTKGRPR